jgi:hypothetical protein
MKRKVGQDIIMRKKTGTAPAAVNLSLHKPISQQPIARRSIPQSRPVEREIPRETYLHREIEQPVREQKKAPTNTFGNLFKKSNPEPVRDQEFVRERFQQSLPPSRGGLMWFFVGIAVLILMVTVFSIISRARVSITLQESRYSINTPVTLYEEPAENQVGYKTATVVDKQSTIVPTTNRDNGGSAAVGSVKLFSTSGTTLSIPAKTVLISSSTGKKFTTDKKITLAAGSVKKPASADVMVTAMESGESYNIGRDDFTVEKFQNVTGRSVNDISGGSSNGKFILTPDVLLATQQQLATQIKMSDPSVYLSKQIPSNFLLLNTLTQTSEITFSQQSVATGVEVIAERTITGNMIDRAAVKQFLRYAGINETEQVYMEPTDISLVQISLQNTATTQSANPVVENKTLGVNVSGSFVARAQFDNDEILKNIAHKRKKEAQKILENIPGITNVSITMWPPWIGKIPNRSSAITILTSFGVSA